MTEKKREKEREIGKARRRRDKTKTEKTKTSTTGNLNEEENDWRETKTSSKDVSRPIKQARMHLARSSASKPCPGFTYLLALTLASFGRAFLCERDPWFAIVLCPSAN